MRIVHRAFDAGINFFDTGHNYSDYNAEPRLGRAIKEILATRDRAKIVVSSKAGTVTRKAFPLRQIVTDDFSPDYIEGAVAASIKNLNCDHLDIFYLHGLAWSRLTDDLFTRLEKMKRRGMYRYLGLNTHWEADMISVSENPGVFDVLLIDASVLQLHRFPVIDKLRKSGVGVVTGTVLGQGHLISGKIGRIRSLADVWYLARARIRPDGKKLSRHSAEMRRVLSTIPGMSPAQAAVAFILQNPNVSSCVFGTTRLENLEDVVGASHRRLSTADVWAIRRAYENLTVKLSH